MKLVDDAVDRAFDSLDDNLEYSSDETYGYFGSGVVTATVARLRLDFEFQADESGLKESMKEQLKEDLAELVVNGDKYNVKDPLLNSMDGEKRRGQSATLVDIFRVNTYNQYRPNSNIIEYTVYLLMAVKFES